MVPKLRFPEFRDAMEWEETTIGQLGKIVPGLTYRPDDIREEGVLVLRSSNIQNGLISLEDNVYVTPKIKGANPTKPNDILICVRNGSKPLIGKNALIPEGMPSCTHGAFMTVLRAKSAKFIFQLFQTETYKRRVEADLGATINSINTTQLKKYAFFIPKPNEQQKIVDCLSSLDELITAQAHKLDTLKAHKKGVMQQLFPAPGQTTPTLRFPEFQDAGEWKAKNFGEVCKFVRGPFGGALKKDIFVKSGYAVYEQSHAIYQNFDSFRYFITEEKYKELKRFAVAANDIIMSCSGTMGKFAIVPKDSKEGVINQALLKLTVRRGFNIDFIKYTLELPSSQEKLLSQSAGGAIKNVVGVTQLKEIEIDIPNPPEQQKIADCLSSLDELIAAQAHKFDILKAHKKGLMQQLFPNPDKAAE